MAKTSDVVVTERPSLAALYSATVDPLHFMERRGVVPQYRLVDTLDIRGWPGRRAADPMGSAVDETFGQGMTGARNPLRSATVVPGREVLWPP